MADAVSFDSLLNTTAGMTAVVNNKKHDDDVVSVTGVDWFTYAGKTASTIYVSGNNFIGFGQNAEQLKIWRRDGAIYYVYRQEGTLTSGKRFLKIRVEGYVYYSSTSSSYALKYEVFLIEGQTLFINVVQVPTDNSYTGTSSITDGNSTTNLNISISSTVPISILVKNAGVSQEITYEKYSDLVIASITVSKMPDKTIYYQKELFDKTGLEISGTTSTGETVSVTDYKLSGYDSSSSGTKTITVTSGNVSATFDVTILADSLTGISITTMPSKTEYHINGEFEPSGISVSSSASDGNTVALNPDQLTYSGFDSSSPGNKTITASYNGMTSSFDITIMTPVSIQAQGYSGTAYFVGDTSNVSVSYIDAKYSDGITDSHINSGYTVTQVDTSTVGQKNAIVDYFGVTTEVLVNVLDSYNAQAGTPNLEDVTISFNLDTGIMDITGTGEFLPYYRLENVPSSLNQKIKILNIGNGITKIPDGLFYKISIVESVSFPNTLTEIGNSNFTDNNIITTLDFPESLKTIGSSSFYGLSNLQEITFHEGLETIKEQAFNDCPLVKNLVLPSTLKNMVFSFRGSTLENLEIGGEGALFSASGGSGINGVSAKNIIIRGGTIKQNTFYSDKNIESVNLNGNVVFDGYGQFQNCSNLSNVIIGDGITSIPQGCFSGCAIKAIVIPDSVIELGETAFSNCKSLKNITLSKSIKKIPNSCFSSCGFETFSIPDDSSIEELENVVFQGCNNLETVYIGKSVNKIGPGCFAGNSYIKNITINRKKDSISGSPWASTGTITWLIRVARLEVTHMPTKTRYFVGETFDSTGLIIAAYYNDNTSEQVTGYTLSSPDMSAYGIKTVTVTFDEKTVDFSILVVDISGIEVKTMPTKVEYQKGDVFDTTGLSILVKYTDGTSETMTTGFEVSGFDSSSVGEKTITVTYKTHTATFKVIVYDLSGIRITSFPSKVYYKIGETFDPSGLTVAEVRQDGTEKEITDYDISGFDSSTAGSKTITVSYNTTTNGVSKFVGSDSFQIKVTNDGKNPFDDSSSGGSGDVEEEKTEPIKITVHWINGEFADLTNENIDQNTLTLQESICSESYFIFGGCVCNQITFQAHHDQFNGTSEEFYPSGKIEVYIERKKTKIKIFTGEIDSAERKANSLTRNFIAYDYLYKLRNTDIARWYKNQTTDKKKKLTQKQFRDKLFEFLGLEQVSTKLHWDDTYVPDTNNSNEMNVVNILKDLCLQNDRFGWMNRDGKFEYLKLRQNSYRYGQTTDNQNIYKYYNNEEVHLDTFKSFTAKEGRIWFPNIIFCDPDPNRAFGFTQGDYTAQEAYDNNVYYNRNSFFVGNEDWLNYVWDADEYGGISRAEPIMKICYGVFVNQDLRKYYRAQGYTAEVQGNPLNMVGQAVELYYKKQIQHDEQEPTELQWYVHSYIMSRTLKIGATDMIDTYSANNAPFNSNSQQLGKYTPEISGTVNLTRSEMPTISYAEFTDGSDSEFSPAMIDDFTDGSGGSGSTSEQLKKAQLRCVKRIKKADYDALVAAGIDRTDTLYFTFEEE